MKSRNLLVLVALGAFASTTTQAALISGLTQANFTTPTIETFSNTTAQTASYDFGNGMVYSNLANQSDLINYTSSYGMGTEPSVNGGIGGAGTGYFGTAETPTTFQFSFSGGIVRFGFFGAESKVSNGSAGRNGQLDLSFYDLSNVLIGSTSVTTAGVFAWDQFHGFMSDANAIGRVVFNNVGHMVLDNVYFDRAPTVSVPEPASLALFALAFASLGFSRKKHA